MITELDEAGLALIKEFEGCVLHAYLDSVNVPTIGIGNTYYEDGTKVTMQDPPITQERADGLFKAVSKDFSHAVAYSTKPVLTRPQFNALFCLCYNIGTGGFKGSTVLKIVNGEPGDLHTAWIAWDKAGGKVNQGLLNRREKEYKVYCS